MLNHAWHLFYLTHKSSVIIKGQGENSADPDQTTQIAVHVSDQNLQCLLTEFSVRTLNKRVEMNLNRSYFSITACIKYNTY